MIRYHYLSMTLDGWMEHGRSILNKKMDVMDVVYHHPSNAHTSTRFIYPLLEVEKK